MNLDELERKLIAAARAHPPSEHVPYAFEQRILARLKERPAFDAWNLWARALWKAVTPCVAIMLLLAAYSHFAPAKNAPGTDLSQDFENTVLAAVNADSPTDSLW